MENERLEITCYFKNCTSGFDNCRTVEYRKKELFWLGKKQK